MHADYVKVIDRDDSDGNRFYDLFDFSDLVYDTITSMTFSLTYSHAPQTWFIWALEDWRVYLSTDGGTDSGTREDGGKLDSKSIATFTLTLEDGAVFDQALASQQFSFWFGDEGGFENDFRLYDAKLTLVGEVAPIPLPAAGLLLIGALGGLTMVRRRKSSDKAA